MCVVNLASREGEENDCTYCDIDRASRNEC